MSLEIEIEERMYVSQERSYHLKSGKRIRVSPGVNGIAQVRRFSSGILLETFVITEEQTYGEYFKDMRFSVKCIAETVLVKIGGENNEVSHISDITRFGAVGDGVTDDTAAFQTALDSNVREIHVPPGNYVISDQLTHSGKAITFTGAGINKSVLTWGADATSTGLSLTQADDDYHIHISGLSFVTGKPGTGTAIAVDGSGQITGGNIQNRSKPRLLIENVEFRGSVGVSTDGWGYGLDAVSVLAAQVRGLYFAGKYTTTGSNIVSVSMCRFSGAGNPVQISVMNCDAYYAQECVKFELVEGAYVQNCNLVSVDKGVVFDGVSGEPQLQCSNNHINAYVTGVEVTQGHQSNISNNLIYSRTGALDVVNGVHLKDGTLYSKVTGNIFVSAAGSETIDGVVMESTASGNFIDGNLFQGGRNGITTLGSSTANDVGINYFNGTTTNFFGGATLRYLAGVTNGVHSFDNVIRPQTHNAFDIGTVNTNAWRSLYLGTSLFIGSSQVVGSRGTGWGAAITGTADKTTALDVSTATTAQLAARFKALEDALRTHGLIGS